MKFSESHKRLTVAYELEEFLHGPLGTVQNGDMIFFLFGEEGLEKERMKLLYRQMKTITPLLRGGRPFQAPRGNSMNLPFSLRGGEFSTP